MYELVADEDAVSPVISVILMVAVTVILAAVISVFVLDLAESSSSDVPSADFGIEQNNETSVDGNSESAEYKTVQIVHRGGDNLDEANVYVTVDGETAYSYRQGTSKLYIETIWQGSGEISSGLSETIISGTASMDNEDFSTGGPYEYDIETNGDGLQPQNTGTEDFEDNTELRTGEVIRVAWRSETGESGVVLLEYTVK